MHACMYLCMCVCVCVCVCRLECAESYEEWLEAARHLDELEGFNEWKREMASPYYDAKRIQQQLAEMTRLKADGDCGAIVYWLRTSMQRNMAGIGNKDLYHVLTYADVC